MADNDKKKDLPAGQSKKDEKVIKESHFEKSDKAHLNSVDPKMFSGPSKPEEPEKPIGKE